MTKIQSM